MSHPDGTVTVVNGRSNLVWTVVGVLFAIALIIFIVTHVSAH